MPTELELIALQTEFDLYLGFTKRLVINLPNSKDRCRAAMWLQKLREVSDPNQMKLRNEHLKLLLFALHRRSIVGVFGCKPPEELESFHDGLTLTEMTRELIEITEAEKAAGGNLEDPTKSPLPPIYCNLSSDFKEYTSAQEIPKFGAHVFYAISNEPIQFWNKRGATKYPGSGDIPNAYQWELAFNRIDDGVLANQAEIDRQIKVAKAIEAGEMTEDDLHPPIDFSKKIHVEKSNPIVFKWKKDSYLTLHQNYDNAGNGPIEDLQGQGKNQLELDEDAFSILDRSLPGRLRVVVRDPFYKDLPVDVSERRTHGIIEEIPEPEEDEPEPEEDEAPCNCDQIDAACNEGGNQDMNCQFDQPPGGFDPCMCQECTGVPEQNGGNQNQQQFYGGNGNMNNCNAPYQAPPPQQGNFDCQGSNPNQGGNDGGGPCTCNKYCISNVLATAPK